MATTVQRKENNSVTVPKEAGEHNPQRICKGPILVRRETIPTQPSYRAPGIMIEGSNLSGEDEVSR